MQTAIIAFFDDLKGIFVKPGPTLGRMMTRKQWAAGFALIVVLIGIFSFITLPHEMAQSSEWLENSRFAEVLADQSGGAINYTSSFQRSLLTAGALFSLVLSLAVGTFFVYLFYGIGGTEGMYVNYFSLVVNASIIDTVIPAFLSMVSIPLGINLVGFTNATLFFPNLPGNTFKALLLAQLDVFSIWYLVVIAAGVAVFAGITFKKSLRIAIFYFCFRTAVIVLFSYLSMKMFGM